MPTTFTVDVGPAHADGSGWPITCACGWVRGVPATDDHARQTAKAWAEAHLREDHGVDRPAVRWTESVTTLTGLDERLFTAEERRRYHALRRTSPRHGSPLEAPRTWSVLALWLLIVAAVAAVVAAVGPEPDTHHRDDILGVVLMVVVLGGAALVVATAVREVPHRRRRRIAAYLDSIAFHERGQAGSAPISTTSPVRLSIICAPSAADRKARSAMARRSKD